MIDEWPQTLVDILVQVLDLTCILVMTSGREPPFDTENTGEFVAEVGPELGTPVSDDLLWETVDSVRPLVVHFCGVARSGTPVCKGRSTGPWPSGPS